MDGFVVKVATLVVLLATCMQQVHATEQVFSGDCKALNRDIAFASSGPGQYTDARLETDFDGFTYFKRREMASITDIDGSKYLDVKLHNGCIGTVGGKGCGLQGALPLFGMGYSATLEYTVRFGDGFNFVRGGKLMGLCSGACKSGCHSSADQGFSARIMWGPEGSLYLYTYTYSGSTYTCGMNTKPSTPIRLQPGQDYRIRLTVRMNTPGQSDGLSSLYVNGEHIVTATGLQMRTSLEQVVDSMVFHTFFGGSGWDWEATKDEHILFKSIKIWDGDCGGSEGAEKQMAVPNWDPPTSQGPQDARVLPVTSHIYGTWNGRFCLWYEVKNEDAETCEKFVLQTSVNPEMGVMASYTNLQVMKSDDVSGMYMFTRDQDKHGKLKQGQARNGNVCLSTPRNIKQSEQRINSNFFISAYCQGAY